MSEGWQRLSVKITADRVRPEDLKPGVHVFVSLLGEPEAEYVIRSVEPHPDGDGSWVTFEDRP